MAENILPKIRDYFGMTSAEFTKEWKKLTAEDRQQIKNAFTSGSMTY